MAGTEKTVEYRGCRGVVIAEIVKDTAEAYETGEVMKLAPVAEISKTTETSSETKFYDNLPKFNHNGEGPDTVTLTCAIPDDAVRAMVEGRVYDEDMKAYIEAPRKNRYFALGYILGEEGTEEDEIFVWKYKGTFNIPDQTSATKDNGTAGNNMSIVFTGVFTEHKFANGGGKGVADTSKGMFKRKADVEENVFFAQVYTPDTATA
jgi:phi13 family phage major tail protein